MRWKERGREEGGERRRGDYRLLCTCRAPDHMQTPQSSTVFGGEKRREKRKRKKREEKEEDKTEEGKNKKERERRKRKKRVERKREREK